MIGKKHGPARRLEVRALGPCPGQCRGSGVIKGIFHEMPCDACNGAGIVDAKTGERIELAELVVQLRMRLTRANTENQALQAALEKAGLWPLGGPADDYAGRKNRRGVGGGNMTGD
ncbi:hypothetical protein LF844_09820 [Metapseudomonas lalkuanensis]|uniref:hypothetical protein n=1 Tax=Metapseudomonas lalkuanensis TaxID=2604832 RepID=UPI001CF33373|nr:hypothetical protein [Pseudomonas lalkuanensis]UCP00087.1 hypothetical protein LF844_09820 [Pseudomonas lalkuanensis]